MSNPTQPKQQPQAKKCTKCNQWWGSANFDGMCSGCYTYMKIHGKPKKIEEKTEAAKKQEDATAKYQGTKKGEQQDKTKCWHCKKKVGLLGTECKCNYVFCNVHRMPEDHACTYNYEEEGKDLLKKQVKKLEHHKVGRLDSV